MTDTIQQIAPIVLHNPKTDDDIGDGDGPKCYCCRETLDGEYGVCIQCCMSGCDVGFFEPCSRNGVVAGTEMGFEEHTVDISVPYR